MRSDFFGRGKGVADAFIAFVGHARREKVVAHADAVADSFDQLLSLLDDARVGA
jgi:hypothetical protein